MPNVAPPYDDADADDAEEAAPRDCATGSLSGSHVACVTDPGEPSVQPSSVTGAWPSQFAQVLSETLAGSRPASQLTPWTTEQARMRIGQLGPMLAAARRPRVRRVIVTSPIQGVLEMTVIVDIGARSRAVAVRLERPSPEPDPVGTLKAARAPRGTTAEPAAWLCTAIEAA
ncbi:MAG: Rv3235 family protein [Streptosporangiaceae bacterium]